eukprot:scaffold108468_cov16-Prasinocladus_malaysianus.AAC.1
MEDESSIIITIQCPTHPTELGHTRLDQTTPRCNAQYNRLNHTTLCCTNTAVNHNAKVYHVTLQCTAVHSRQRVSLHELSKPTGTLHHDESLCTAIRAKLHCAQLHLATTFYTSRYYLLYHEI